MSSSTTMHNAQPASQAGQVHVTPRDIAVGVIIGRIGEFFDFFVYGIASVLVFPALFFPLSLIHI